MSGTPSERDDLKALQALWQTQPVDVPVDLEQLRRTLRRRQRYTRLMLWFDWGGTALMFAVIAWVLATSPTLEPRMWLWVGFLAAAGVLALVAGTRVRRPVWSVAEGLDTDAQSLIEASIRQSQASLGIVRIVNWTVWACFVFIAVWAASEFWGGEAVDADELRKRLLTYGFALLYGGAFLVGGAVVARRKRAEIVRWETLRSTL